MQRMKMLDCPTSVVHGLADDDLLPRLEKFFGSRMDSSKTFAFAEWVADRKQRGWTNVEIGLRADRSDSYIGVVSKRREQKHERYYGLRKQEMGMFGPIGRVSDRGTLSLDEQLHLHELACHIAELCTLRQPLNKSNSLTGVAMTIPHATSNLSLSDLVRPEALQAANPHIWPSMDSFGYWRRLHRSELLDADAIVEISGRVLMHGPRTLQVALDAGSKQSRKRAAGGRLLMDEVKASE